MNELDYLREQLNLIIGFLDVSDNSVYEVIKSHDKFELGLSIDDLYGNDYANFKNHVTTSALILGFTHFEDFLTKMTVKILIKYPRKNKMKVTIERFEELGSDYILQLAQEQAKRLTFAEKVKLINKSFSTFNENLILQMEYINKVRNCLMHNNGIADNRLEPEFSNGDKITLTSGKINGYGLMARKFAEELWNQLN